MREREDLGAGIRERSCRQGRPGRGCSVCRACSTSSLFLDASPARTKHVRPWQAKPSPLNKAFEPEHAAHIMRRCQCNRLLPSYPNPAQASPPGAHWGHLQQQQQTTNNKQQPAQAASNQRNKQQPARQVTRARGTDYNQPYLSQRSHSQVTARMSARVCGQSASQ